MTWAPGPIVTRRRLGGELRRLREGAGLNLEAVAQQLECSPSKISRLENGKGIPRLRDVRDMLDAYGLPAGEDRDRLLEWVGTGRAPMWWSRYADVLPAQILTYVELEWDAVRVRAYEPYIVHGLLQTREYARTVLHAAWKGLCDPMQIERMVDVRLQRQEALTSDHGLTFTCVLDESTLHRVVGSRRVQCEQIDHLIGMAEARHVEVRVLPYTAGLVSAGHDPVSLLEFDENVGPTVAHVERFPSEGVFLNDPAGVAGLEHQWEALYAASRPERESIPLLERAARNLVDA